MLELIFWVAVAALALFAARQFEAHERRRDGNVIITPPPKAPDAPVAIIVPPASFAPDPAASAVPAVTTAPSAPATDPPRT